MRAWPAADLVRRLCRALEIADRAVRTFGDDGYRSPDGADESVSSAKILSETALLLLASAPASRTSPAVRERHEELLGGLEPLATGERVRAALCLEPAHAREHAFAYACISALGRRDERLDELLAASLAAEASSAGERPPHRELERRWLARTWDPSAARARDETRLLRDSALGHAADVLAPTRDEMYAFTHALMYATGLGSRQPRLPRARRRVAETAESFVAWCLDEQDYDLGGEALLTWPLLRLRWSAPAAFAFAVLASVEDRAGFLPSPAISLERYGQLDGEERGRYALAAAYHTAFVMGLLCAASLRDGCAPPARVPSRGGAGVDPSRLVALLDDARERHWLEHYRHLDESRRAALVPLLLDLCLQRAAARRDLGAVQAAVRVALGTRWASRASVGQAAQLLRRASLLAEGVEAVHGDRAAGALRAVARSARPRRARATQRGRPARPPPTSSSGG